MTIEQSLDRIAVALEAIAAAIPVEECACEKPQTAAGVVPDGTGSRAAETPKKKTTKKSAPKQDAPIVTNEPEVIEAVEDDLDLGLDTVQSEPVKAYTADDVRSAISNFITSFTDIKEGKKAALDVLNRYGYAKIPEIAEKDYAAIIADVSKGGK